MQRSSHPRPIERAAAVVSAVAVLAVGAVTLSQVEGGPISIQMVQHLAVMNVAAPLAAAFLPFSAVVIAKRWFLVAAALVQLALLWVWHAPGVQHAAEAAMSLHMTLLGALTLAALAFWIAILASAATGRWTAILALLLTGKLACLLGALLIFAPRELYELAGYALAAGSGGLSALEDQQLAGLLMIVACPLSYLVAGVILAVQAIADLERAGPEHRSTSIGAG